MFERYLTDALTTHFGHVVENLDSDKVRLSAWDGQLVLENLSLRSNALESFMPDCPVEIAYGKVGNLELRIPWTLFRSQLLWRRETDQPRIQETRCSIVLTDVNILITPRRTKAATTETNESEQDDSSPESIEEQRRQREKQVQSLLDANLLRRVTESSVSSSRWSWVQDWLSSLLSTLSVTVRNIHIRYEDPGTSMGYVWSSNDNGDVRRYRPAFSVGITLRQFSVLTDDPQQLLEDEKEDAKNAESNEAASGDGTTKAPPLDGPLATYDTRHKVAAAERLAIYWDSDCKLMSIHSDELCESESRTEYSAYYQSSFQVLNDGSSPLFAHESLFKHNHAYLLDPISPSVNLTLVSKVDSEQQETLESAYSHQNDESSNDSVSAPPNAELTPPSSVSIDLPPCKFTLSRSTMEDTAYIRKSLSVWNHAAKGLLSESSLRRLAKLRPSKSPRDDPKSWWIYASETSLKLSRVNREGRDLEHLGFYRKRRRGWMGLVQALARRRCYLDHYKLLLTLDNDEKTISNAHNLLLEMEDELLPEEIAAFRIAVYESTNLRRASDVENDGPSKKAETDEKILTVDHRQWMMYEMSQALDREKANMRSRVREGARQASTKDWAMIDTELHQANPVIWKASLICREFAIQVNDQASGFHRTSVSSIGSPGNSITPIIRVSSAWVQEQAWYQDGSWDIDCSLASLAVTDLISSESKGPASHNYFPNLIGRKQTGSGDDGFLVINGIRYHRSLSISVRRQLHWTTPDGDTLGSSIDRGSTTRTQVRILPMEVVYSTLPAEAMTRVLATIKTPEFLDDYHKLASAAHGWRERQKRKFLRALAHKHKKIIVDIDVGAPELLIPENFDHPESPMLAVDLGRLRVFNEESSKGALSDFDDKWRLVLSNIQVRSTTVASYYTKSSTRSDEAEGLHSQPRSNASPRQLVEPFSLDVAISTKVASEDSQDIQAQTRVRISATLPRLAFNLTSSSMRLGLRLQQQWEKRRREIQARATYFQAPGTLKNSPIALDAPRSPSYNDSSKGNFDERVSAVPTQDNRITRLIQFQFSAPVITLRLDNDVDGRDSVANRHRDGSVGYIPWQTPLVDLSFRGIRGTLLQEVARNGDSTMKFDARLHSLGAIDLYQGAGKDFALLMSSVPQEALGELLFDGQEYPWEAVHFDNDLNKSVDFEERKDLVAIEYNSSSKAADSAAGNDRSSDIADKLSIWFHELYVEWNPETLAAIQKAVRMPLLEDHQPIQQAIAAREVGSVSDDEFYDAIEDEFFDAGSETDSMIHLVSEISSSFEDPGLDLLSPTAKSSLHNSSGLIWGFQESLMNSTAAALSPHGTLQSSIAPLSPQRIAYPRSPPILPSAFAASSTHNKPDTEETRKPFEVVFKLSKLRVSFNKETRHRKVMVAQMDGTSVSYATRPAGGSRTIMSIGNLVFSDPATSHNTTLYRQILGLKSRPEDEKGERSSLLEMEILVNPMSRSFESHVDPSKADNHSRSVTIDRGRGLVAGCNLFVRATFSPMRFVFLEQFWSEIIDYFFEGILGTEVWGGKSSSGPVATKPELLEFQEVPLVAACLPGSDAEGFSFTRFDISLDSPELLLPVTYKSPHFVRLELANIHVSNIYDGSVISDVSEDIGDRMQWFNNCDISLQDLRLFSWCGQELGEKPVIADIALRWPTGPTAYLVIPKWTVTCRFDSLDIALRRSDYALLQHILSYNIGEESRHLDEWDALQSLSPDDVEKHIQSIMVHFGYDKKDVAPTTYNLTVAIPSVSFSLIEGASHFSKPLAVARCLDLVWTLRKESDLVVKQRATCDVELGTPSATGFEKMLSLSKYDTDDLGEDGELSDQDSGVPELTYTSTTRPSGDNTKTLEIVDACIYMVVPAWRRFAGFFASLPEPSILNENDIAASIQVGDRWYKMGGGEFDIHTKSDAHDRRQRRFSWIKSSTSKVTSNNARQMSRSSTVRSPPTFQLRVALTSPRIIFSSILDDGLVSRLVLRMHHLEFLHTNNGQERKISRSFFLHEVEVYTLSNKKAKRSHREGDNSLIHSWSVVGLIEKCNGESIGTCDKHTIRISGDILEAHAAYSDMAIAIDVCLSVLHSAREERPLSASDQMTIPISSGSSDSLHSTGADAGPHLAADTDDDLFCSQPDKFVYDIKCDGFELRVSDDSGRHFARTQDLIILSLGKLLFNREESQNEISSIKLRLDSLDLYDCLQAEKSPFRTAASSRSGDMCLNTLRDDAGLSGDVPAASGTQRISRQKMSWEDYSTRNLGHWNFEIAPALLQRALEASVECASTPATNEDTLLTPELIEITCIFSGKETQDYKVKLRSLAVQWNPSTIIGIQRFLGRLRKESKMKAVQVFHQQLDDMIAPPSMGSSEEGLIKPTESTILEREVKIRAIVEVESLTVCLNKEHQNRRLLELTLSSCQIELDSSEFGLSVDGRLGDLRAWDSDNYSTKSSDKEAIMSRNRDVLKVISSGRNKSREASIHESSLDGHAPFLEVRYKTFKKKLQEELLDQQIPSWVQSHMSETGDIDDFLSLTVAALQFTYLKERTDELMDYLSNGLPGKGMGATSRAAKGFLTKRILTRSFLEFHVDSPQVLLPQHESVLDGIALKLGDVNIRSWFEEATPNASRRPQTTNDKAEVEWWRILSLGLTGFCGGILRDGADLTGSAGLSSATNPIDLEIILRKPTVKGRELSMRGKLSFVEMSLNYSDYVFLRAVVRDNIGRKVNTEKWDNVEKAYWSEEAAAEDLSEVGVATSEIALLNPSPLETETRVAYSSNARFVRYGKQGQRKQNVEQNDTLDSPSHTFSQSHSTGNDANTLDVRFELDGLSLKLRRDDKVEGVREGEEVASAFQYDIMLLRVQVVEISVTANGSGDVSFHLSLFRIGLFDLGDRGRLIRERYHSCLSGKEVADQQAKRKGLRQPCPFFVLAEGYSPVEESGVSTTTAEGAGDGPQFVVTIDRCPASSAGAIGSLADYELPDDSKVTIARIVINYLSVNALIRPFREIIAFLSCDWPTHDLHSRLGTEETLEKYSSSEQQVEATPTTTQNQGFQLKLVAHYPRVFFLADESDPHSRALVLRGLAVVNLSNITITQAEDVQRITAVDAQLQSMESYINPDVDEALRFKQRHADIVGESFSALFPLPQEDQVDSSDTSDALGVALIQPVTTGLEYCEIRRDLFPTKRSVFVNVEPVSTMLSFEDLQLIEAVLKRWSSARSSKASSSDEHELNMEVQTRENEDWSTYDVVFHSQRLGLGLKTEANQTVVNSIQNAEHMGMITTGDTLVAIDGANFEKHTLQEVVKCLSGGKRPISIKFKHLVPRLPSQSNGVAKMATTEKESWQADDYGKEENKSDFFVSSYTISFRSGVPHGLELEKSMCGGYPVVTKILPAYANATAASAIDESNSEEIEATFEQEEDVRAPRAGAVLVALNNVSVEELGQEEAWHLLSILCSVKNEADSDADSESEKEWEGVYSLSFKEIDSSLWGNIETIDLSSSGIALSFIDDLNGRDMPLFRGKLNTLEVHAERGIAAGSRIIEVKMPSLLKLGSGAHGAKTSVSLSQEEIDDLNSESIITFSGIAMCSIDYFHPRIAYWEPLLEPSQLFLLFEKQAGSIKSNRAGQLAVEISDRLLREQTFRGNVLPTISSEPQMVAFNLTDASAEVFVKASSQWKEWRMGVSNEAGDEEDESFEDDIVRETKQISEQSLLTTVSAESAEIQIGDAPISPSRVNERTQRHQEAQHVAAQKAAQAALVFAQKRGAATSKKGESAKPFIFRNRTGVSIAFVQQEVGRKNTRRSVSGRRRSRQNLSVVGEYSGLEEYDPLAIRELADEENAKFSMEVLSDESLLGENEFSKGNRQMSNKIRSYEGRFPSLTVAIQAVSGVFVEPIADLQVFKVGSMIRHLVVRKDVIDATPGSRDSTQYSIPVVWKVEIEDNRRILTLSTAVRVVSTGYNMPIEVGVQKDNITSEARISEGVDPITSIGIARPESPFYLPLWLALKLESVDVYVRPASEGKTGYRWGTSGVLHFGPLLDKCDNSSDIDPNDIGKWVWEESFAELSYIRCNAVREDSNPVWLSVFGSSSSTPVRVGPPRRSHGKAKAALPPLDFEEEINEVISVTLDSGLTLRNMLPMSLDWELAHSTALSKPLIVDGSSVRSENVKVDGTITTSFFDESLSVQSTSLNSGECTEVFACDYESQSLLARFKEPDGKNWSSWATLSLEEAALLPDDHEADDPEDGLATIFPSARQVNVQVTNDKFGVPLTFGVRIVPKTTLPPLDDPSRAQVYGLEVILYAELWIRNITSLPLNFGCPSYQVHESGHNGIFDESATRFTAESALMELASLLEVGDKGTGLSNKAARDVSKTGGIESLPNQECSALLEEVFEYIEIDSSTVKRRWWGSESYDSYRKNITQSTEGSDTWSWIDENWSIDCSGQSKASVDGWESCRNLLAGAGSFNGQRQFHPAHAIRRRRFFRTRSGRHVASSEYTPNMISDRADQLPTGSLLGGFQAFHQPLEDSFSREQRNLRRKRKGKRREKNKAGDNGRNDDETLTKVAIKCGDGKWSLPATIPDNGTSHGVLRVLSSRWPALTRARGSAEDQAQLANGKMQQNIASKTSSPYTFRSSCLDSDLFELCYTVSDVEGEWGELSRSMVVSPRFLLRNDSERFTIEIKQTGAPGSSSLKLAPGEVQPFYWADFRLPGLVSVHPVVCNDFGRSVYKWSGGFDLCNLGMIPIRIRRDMSELDDSNTPLVRSIRALVEIRPGTGGFGINVSFRDEDPTGDGSLFRVENLSSFPIWLSQDGVLANPSATFLEPKSHSKVDGNATAAPKGASPRVLVEDHASVDGDLIRPSEKSAFALDVPYRQGKYAHRKEASLVELLRVRVALAPLASRAGIETVKVIGLTTVGEGIRLNPSKLIGSLSTEMRNSLQRVRILAIVTTDGPTRVLKFCMLAYPATDMVFSNPFGDVSYTSSNQKAGIKSVAAGNQRDYTKDIAEAGMTALGKLKAGQLPTEDDAKREALFGDLEKQQQAKTDQSAIAPTSEDAPMDQVYSFRAAFSGFIFSLVDSAPSEIAVASLRNFNVLARWNAIRSKEASLILSVGWLQVDNHIPSAPFKVAVRPDQSRRADDEEETESSRSPLLMVAIAFAPKHKSGIVCLRSVTVAPRNLVIAVDLAFLVRLQRFFAGLRGHFKNQHFEDIGGMRGGTSILYTEQKRFIAFPHFESAETETKRAAAFGTENQKMHFQGLTILPCNITLSVAPARALTATQGSLEGKDIAAIHQAVRKGDVLVGSSSALLGVRVGRKNTTPLAVVRGVFKSIVVDALLRLDGASLNFSGVFLRNHISTGPQLTTYLLAHYLASLRHNVPALLGSLAAFGNPLGLIRGLGDGVSDFVSEPVKGLKKSVKELDPTFLVDGVARGTESLARHAVGGFADSASLLTETFSKNMAVLTLDRRYAQKRDRGKSLRLNGDTTVTMAGGVESGFVKLVQGFMDGVTGVVKAPMRGAEKRGIEGFAKGIGKGLLGLLVKPMIGISDAATDVMIGVKSTVGNNEAQRQNLALNRNQIRPRRPMYGRDKVLRPYKLEDAAAATLMLRMRCAGENYLSHIDMGDQVALLSVRRLILLGPSGQELMSLKYKHVSKLEARQIKQEDGSNGWGIVIVLNTPRRNGSEVEVISCQTQQEAEELCSHIQRGVDLVASDAL